MIGRIAQKLVAVAAAAPDAFGADVHRFRLGTLTVADHGCTLTTQLVVTGLGRGRLFNVDVDGIGPYVLEDEDFLAWYERSLDELLAGCRIGWFGEKLPGDEAVLVAVLHGDPSSRRRARAVESLTQLPAVTIPIVQALAAATDLDPVVRTAVLELLGRQRDSAFAVLEPKARAALHDPAASVREAAIWALRNLKVSDVAICARSLTTDPDPGVRWTALQVLADRRWLTVADLAPCLISDDVQERRRAAGLLADVATGEAGDGATAELTDTVLRMLVDDDVQVRNRAAHAVRRRRLDQDLRVWAAVMRAEGHHTREGHTDPEPAWADDPWRSSSALNQSP